MKLKHLFVILALLLLGVWVVMLVALLSAGILQPHSRLLCIATGLLTVGLFYLIYFYNKVVKPLRIIANGMDLLREQDFGSRLLPVGQTDADRIVVIFNRMMEQLKNERLRLREQNHFLDLLINVSPMGVIILSMDGKISMANAAALRFLDLPKSADLSDMKVSELDSPLAVEISRLPRETTRTIRLGDSQVYRCSHLSFVDYGFAHPFLLIESLTSEVVKAEKKAYEKVIRMISHEVNNTTAGITSTLDTVSDALATMGDTGDLREVMRVCIERCYQMSGFITRFADVVKIPEAQLRPESLNKRVEACKVFMENLCSQRHIGLHLDLCAEEPEVMMDSCLFEQVLVNIIKNAVESVADATGEVYIRTTARPTMLEVADTGAGISKEVESKLFTPFFSTKPAGQGIGLVFIREVLMKHGCSFSLRTYEDGLTRFRIYFE